MSHAGELWSRHRDLAERCLAHPFVRGLSDGSLSEKAYSGYIAQDAFFLDAFARAYAMALVRSEDRATMRAFHDLLGGVFKELKLHEKVAAERGIDLRDLEPLPATVAYTDFLAARAHQGTVGEVLAAMTPCMRLYRFLGIELAREGNLGTRRDWLATYAGEELGKLVSVIEGLLDRSAVGSPGEAVAYRRALELEVGFFDSAWRIGT